MELGELEEILEVDAEPVPEQAEPQHVESDDVPSSEPEPVGHPEVETPATPVGVPGEGVEGMVTCVATSKPTPNWWMDATLTCRVHVVGRASVAG